MSTSAVTKRSSDAAVATAEIDDELAALAAKTRELTEKRRRLSLPAHLLKFYDLGEHELVVLLQQQKKMQEHVLEVLRLRYPHAYKKQTGCTCGPSVICQGCDHERFGDY